MKGYTATFKSELKVRKASLKEFWRRYRKNKAAVLGLGIVTFFGILAIFAPLISPYSPWQTGFKQFSPPSWQHPMGTDDLGRDIFSQILWGARLSLFVGLLAAATSSLIGTLIGAVSGYCGGRIDDLLMRITELFMIIPQLILLMVLIALFGTQNVWQLILVIGGLSWPSTARLVRAEVISLKERPFVEAVVSLGAGHKRIIFSEILPNALAPIIVNASLQVGNAIIVEAGLSFLGLGIPDVISWGYILNRARRYIQYGWHMSFFPGLVIFLTVLGLNLIGDGLNDALNPRLKER